MNEKQADLFDATEEQIKGIYEEIGLLSKKKPDSPINKFKLKFINQILEKTNELLQADYLPFPDFTGFEEDDLPSASDVVLILSQYLKNMNKFRYDHVTYNSGSWYWVLDGENKLRKVTKRSNFLRTEK